MATRNIVPRATGEGSIGTSAKTWSAVYANDIAVTNGVSASTFTGNLTGTASGNLPLSGGSITGDVDITGDLSVTGAITGNVTGNVTGTASGNLALSGGTMTGSIQYVDNGKVFTIGKTPAGNVDLCWDGANREGAGLALRSSDYSSPGSSPGEFILFARDANNDSSLKGKPDGSLTWNSQPLLPVGIVQAFAGTTIPAGWLLCDGSAVSRTTYAALYAVIGTTYGTGDGSTTFNLPDLVDKFVEGSATAGTVKSAGLPNITGDFDLRSTDGGANVTWATERGAIKVTTVTNDNSTSISESSSHGKAMRVSIDASRSSAVYGKSSTVQPPALTMRYIIKF